MQLSRFSAVALLAAVAAFAANPTRAAGQVKDQAEQSKAGAVVAVQSLSGAFLAATLAHSEGDLDSAEAYYEKALAIDPTSVVLQRQAMSAFIAGGQFRKGLELAAKLRDDEEESKIAHIALGVGALADGQWDVARREFAIVEPSDLDSRLMSHLMAWADVGAGKPAEAIGRIENITGASWFPIFNRYQIGLIASYSNNAARARKAFGELLDDEGSAQSSPDAYLAAAEALARLEARSGNKDAALAAIDRGLALSANYDALTQLKAEIEAGETIAAAVSSPRDGAAEALYILGQAINRGEGQSVALLYFQCARAAASSPSPKLLIALAGTAERSENIDLALSYYKQIPQDSPYRRMSELQIGLDLWYAERKDEARAHLKQTVAAYPDDLQARLAFADVLSADKDYAGAAAVLEQAAALAPEGDAANWNIFYQRGVAYERLKKWEKAEPDFRTALQLSPNQPQVLNYLGYSWVDMNRNLDEGLRMIRTAVDLRPNDGYIIDSLGWAYYRLGRFPDAVEQLERAVGFTPADPTINDHLGDAYWQVGRRREAQFQWNRALVGEPKPDEADVQRIVAKLKDGLTPATESDQPKAVDKRASAGEAPAETGAVAN